MDVLSLTILVLYMQIKGESALLSAETKKETKIKFEDMSELSEDEFYDYDDDFDDVYVYA